MNESTKITPLAQKREELEDGYYRIKNSENLWETFTPEGKQVCGAKNRSVKNPYCNKPPTKGRNRCKLHGGHSPRGIAHPRFEHGKYSRSIIGNLAGKYEQALADERLLEMRDDIALTDARIQDMLERIDSGENGQTWRDMKKVYKELRRSATQNDQQAFISSLNHMGNLIDSGINEWRQWDELSKAQKHKLDMVVSERKYLESKQQMLTAEEAMAMIAHIVSVVKHEVLTHVEKEIGDKLLASISMKVTQYVTDKNRGDE